MLKYDNFECFFVEWNQRPFLYKIVTSLSTNLRFDSELRKNRFERIEMFVRFFFFDPVPDDYCDDLVLIIHKLHDD